MQIIAVCKCAFSNISCFFTYDYFRKFIAGEPACENIVAICIEGATAILEAILPNACYAVGNFDFLYVLAFVECIPANACDILADCYIYKIFTIFIIIPPFC